MSIDMFIDVDGLQVHYEVCGEGENVLVLHGWGGRIGSFAPVISGLSAYRRVIAIDFPGFGETPPPPEPWSVTEYTGLVIGLIRKLGIEGCDVIAHSFGGRVAIMLASGHPELVSKLVLVDAAGIRPRRTLKYHIRVRMFKLGKRVTRSRACMRLLGPVGKAIEKRQKTAGSEDYRALSEDMKRTFVRVVNQDLRPLLPQIKAPTLLVWGDQDADAPLYMGQIMEKEIPDAGLVVFEGAGHFSYLDRFDQFTRVLRSFLGGGK